jgi:porphobilinogen synthase
MDTVSLNQIRLRKNAWIRNLVRRTPCIDTQKLIQPLFITEGQNQRKAINSLPGVYQDTPESVLKQIENDLQNEIHQFLLFFIPQNKSDSPIKSEFGAQQIQNLRTHFGDDIFLSADVCLCSYTNSGHCCILSAEGTHINHQSSLEALSQFALQYAQAGVNCVAPSDMMDNRIYAIRSILDQHQYLDTLIMSYSAKFYSKFYGPFRLAADSQPKAGFKDRSCYQIDPSCPEDAYQSSLRDANQGADILMVKPGLPYLDVLKDLSQKISKPWAIYEVSGEYASIYYLSKEQLIERGAAHLEAWNSMFRAGAQMIITYGARYAKTWLKEMRQS